MNYQNISPGFAIALMLYTAAAIYMWITINKLVAAERERQMREVSLHQMVKDFYKFKYMWEKRQLPLLYFTDEYNDGRGFTSLKGEIYDPYEGGYNKLVDWLYFGIISLDPPEEYSSVGTQQQQVSIEQTINHIL